MQAGVAIRSYEKGYPPEIPFVLVTFASTWVLLNLWRAAITAAYPKKVWALPGYAVRGQA